MISAPVGGGPLEVDLREAVLECPAVDDDGMSASSASRSYTGFENVVDAAE